MRSRFAMQYAMQCAMQRSEGVKEGLNPRKLSFQRKTLIMKILLPTMPGLMEKEIMYHLKKSCYLIPIHYDPEL